MLFHFRHALNTQVRQGEGGCAHLIFYGRADSFNETIGVLGVGAEVRPWQKVASALQVCVCVRTHARVRARVGGSAMG